ncbi:nucleoplasmin-like [Hemicordylus capensis]|uniref:nucleoplasmin-like n=1 Tax=Hemicordylus capensis TaxID=884348 RepID=UPI0023049BA4|nr:nucleoplasmin-like [Hemicordylus capensis]XP_053126285.1 nucleoplasmin-like [Hemicordylus capensis]
MAREHNEGMNRSTRSELAPASFIWGCKLDLENPTYTADILKDHPSEQQLILKTILLTEDAKEEFHTVEILPPKNSKKSPIHIATLKPSVLPMTSLMGFDMTPPVSFRLKSGSGPVHLAGYHLTAGDGYSWSLDDEMEASSKEDSPTKPAKHLCSKQSAAAKEGQEQPQEKGTRKGRETASRGDKKI